MNTGKQTEVDKIEAILTDEYLHDRFKDFCLRNYCIESFNFLEAVRKFKEINREKAEPERLLAMKECYETFIRPFAPEEVNVSHHTRQQIKRIYESTDRDTPLEFLFEDAKKEISRMLIQNLHDRFIALL